MFVSQAGGDCWEDPLHRKKLEWRRKGGGQACLQPMVELNTTLYLPSCVNQDYDLLRKYTGEERSLLLQLIW